jgi:iron-sulfur cluster assembly accessory protein
VDLADRRAAVIMEPVSVEAQQVILSITEPAARKAAQLAEREGHAQAFLRVRVVAGGCSGFGYRLSFETEAASDDNLIEAHGLKVLVDPKSVPILAGSTLEYSDAMLGGGFKVNNPQAIQECACGESFSV